MPSLKKPDLYSYHERVRIAILFVSICFGLLVVRLFWLQVISHNKYATLAESNRIAIVPVPANRGLLIDRNGIVIGRNYSALTLEIDASQIKGNPDLLIDQLAIAGPYMNNLRQLINKKIWVSFNLGSIYFQGERRVVASNHNAITINQ